MGDGELAELHRKYKVMEGDRKAFTEDSQKLIKRQRAHIDKLKRDNEALKDELEMEAHHTGGHGTTSSTATLARLQEQADMYTRKIDLEKRRIEELDKSVSTLNKRASDQRTKVGGVHAAREANLKTQKQIKVLENRLDRSLVKFNEALAGNKQLRESIDNLRRERVVFDQIYQK